MDIPVYIRRVFRCEIGDGARDLAWTGEPSHVYAIRLRFAIFFRKRIVHGRFDPSWCDGIYAYPGFPVEFRYGIGKEIDSGLRAIIVGRLRVIAIDAVG